MSDDEKYHFNKRTDTTYVSSRIAKEPPLSNVRIASRVLDGGVGLRHSKENGQVVIRSTPKGRHEIKATFFEDERGITALTLQKFLGKGGPSNREYFTFVGPEITTLKRFLASIKTLPMDTPGNMKIPDSELHDIILSETQARRLFKENEELFLDLARNHNLKRDIVAIGYRREQLARFANLLNDKAFFASELTRTGKAPEALWQRFFEENQWIFGYGLSYLFLSQLDGRGLEQVVRGHDVSGSGKRTDALMKSQALVSSLCFVEIKRHDTPLLATSAYRPDAWPPSGELSGAVVQMQATVQDAIETLGRLLLPKTRAGDPTGERLFNFAPRSFVVIGSTSQFIAEHGVNEPKFRSFEMYRRGLMQPEIITFDELFHRAKFIIEHVAA